MQIACPFCGLRDGAEFVSRGEARPAPPLDAAHDAQYDYLYRRKNPRGLVTEHWYHAQGCRSWLLVERDTRTHAVHAVALAKTP